LQKGKKKLDFFTKTNILINNFHPSLKSPLTKTRARTIIENVIKTEKCNYSELIVNFTNNAQIMQINKKYLNHNYFTDIITFQYDRNRKSIEGEMFISLDSVKENAKSYKTGYKNELSRVLIHGCLHLTGYNDKTKRQQELIRRKENFYLSN